MRSTDRYIYLRKLPGGKFATEYAWGPSIKYTIAKQHTLENGQKLPLWAKLETPQVCMVFTQHAVCGMAGYMCAWCSACWQRVNLQVSWLSNCHQLTDCFCRAATCTPLRNTHTTQKQTTAGRLLRCP